MMTDLIQWPDLQPNQTWKMTLLEQNTSPDF
jgi:hypothetical protein